MPVIICISSSGTDHKVKLLGYLGQANLANFVSWLRKYLWLSNALYKYLKYGKMANPHVLIDEKNNLLFCLYEFWLGFPWHRIYFLHRLPVSFCTINGCHYLNKWFLKTIFLLFHVIQCVVPCIIYCLVFKSCTEHRSNRNIYYYYLILIKSWMKCEIHAL